MQFNNKLAAEALLRLFNVYVPLDQFAAMNPQGQPECSIYHSIAAIDHYRAGELLCSDPAPALLNDAYQAGYRLAFTGSFRIDRSGKPYNTRLTLLHPHKPNLNFDIKHTDGKSDFYEEVWAHLKKELCPATKPVITVKEMGEDILNAFSKSQARLSQGISRGGDWQIFLRFGLREHWGFKHINQFKLNLLLNLLRESFASARYDSDLTFSFENHESNESRDKLSDGKVHYRQKTDELCLCARVSNEKDRHLHAIDYAKVLNVFRMKIAALNHGSIVVEPAAGGTPTRVKLFDRFDYSRNDLTAHLPGQLTKREMDLIMKGLGCEHEAARSPRKLKMD